MKTELLVDDFRQLYIEITTLGYPKEGESILVSLCEGNCRVFSVITDCFKTDCYDYWLKHEELVKPLNAFIWTHPDRDHSTGIQSLLDFADPKHQAEIYVPAGLSLDFLKKNGRKAEAETLSYIIKNYNKGRKYKWHDVSVDEGEEPRTLYIVKLTERSTRNELYMRFRFMLPIGAVDNRRFNESKLNAGEMNDISIVYIIELNGIRYFFGGDLSKINIQNLDSLYLTGCRFIKIPHHGSKEPISLLDKISSNGSSGAYSVTTVKEPTNPFPEVLDAYSRISNAVFSTHKGVADFGIVRMRFNIIDLKDNSVEMEGNAQRVRCGDGKCKAHQRPR